MPDDARAPNAFVTAGFVDEGGQINACGGAGALCFEADGAEEETKWAYVGNSRGAYEKVQTFTYVGNHGGSFEKETVITYSGWRIRWCCMLWAFFLVLAGAIFLWWYLAGRWTGETERTIRVVTSRPFDCNAGYWNWEKGWSIAKKQWCCDHIEKGCPPATTSAAFDCDAAFMNWQRAWSAAKKDWCCSKYGRGCPVQDVKVGPHYRCHEGQITRWTIGKQTWCCANYQVGCATRSSLPYDCHAGLANWHTGWSIPKKHWCCAHFRLGCYVATSLPYDCHAGVSNWQQGWSHAKKQWCCGKTGVGCHVVIQVTSLPYDCNAGLSNWQAGWSDGKKHWCCVRQGKGCLPHVTSLPYDCDAGYSNWQAGWSDGKKSWCCAHVHRGCASTTLSPLGCATPCRFDGQTATCHDRIQYLATHQFAHQANACGQAYSRVQVECHVCQACSIQEAHCEALPVSVAVHTSRPYDCNAGFSNWQAGWSPSKKSWCCANEHRGCEAALHAAYDCNAGLSNFAAGWSDPKKHWCCSHEGKGCTGSSPPAMACAVGYHWVRVQVGGGVWTWKQVRVGAVTSGYLNHQGAETSGHLNPPGVATQGMMWKWTQVQGSWGWHMVSIHGSLPYDCDAGLSNFKVGWSEEKKTWCCHHLGKGCQ